MRPEGTLELLDRFMYQHVALEFVLAVESSLAAFTLVGLLITVYDHVDTQVVLRLEALVANLTLVLTWTEIRGN